MTSRARNAGLDIAAGQYIVFVDSDDYVEENYLETFDGDESDLVTSCSMAHDSDGSIVETTVEAEETIEIKTEKDYINFLKKWYGVQVWGKRLKHSILDALRFDEAFQYGEDSIFIAQYLLRIRTLKICGNVTYHYCMIHADSLCKKAKSNWFATYSASQEKILALFDGYPLVQQFLAEKYCWVAESELVKICSSDQTRKEKQHAVQTVLHTRHLAVCAEKCENNLPFRTRALFRSKSSGLAMLIYGTRRHN